jgi:hypothetical protein
VNAVNDLDPRFDAIARHPAVVDQRVRAKFRLRGRDRETAERRRSCDGTRGS